MSGIVTAQEHGGDSTRAEVAPTTSWQPHWSPLFESFLEPNRFSTVYDQTPHYLRLEAGFGGETVIIGKTAFGAECLIWSGLKSLSNFRFPVETADYFFGIYSVFPLYIADFAPVATRVRLSHISSHWVDGVQDSIVGGSSSHFSREFVSVEFENTDYDQANRPILRASVGLKYVFHQVTKVEPEIQFPTVVEFVPLCYGAEKQNELFVSFALDGAASAPMLSGAVVSRMRNLVANSVLDLYAEYHDGATRYGAKGALKEHGFEFGIRIGKNLLQK